MASSKTSTTGFARRRTCATAKSLYSRTLSDVARAFPEVARRCGCSRGDAIFDGEIVALRDGRVLPFRFAAAPAARDLGEALQARGAGRYVAFDVLASGARFLLDAPLAERRAELAVSTPRERLRFSSHLGTRSSPARRRSACTSERGFERPARGNEGLMLKRSRFALRSRAGAESGGSSSSASYRRSTASSSESSGVTASAKAGAVGLHVAVRRRAPDSGDRQSLPGLTDAEIAEMTEWFLAHRADRELNRNALARIPVEP